MPIPRVKNRHLRDRQKGKSETKTVQPDCEYVCKTQNETCSVNKHNDVQCNVEKSESVEKCTTNCVSQSQCVVTPVVSQDKNQSKSRQSKKSKQPHKQKVCQSATKTVPVVESIETSLNKNTVQVQLINPDKTITALVDTGADLSCLSSDLYQQHFSNVKLQAPTHVTVKGVSGRMMTVEGKCDIAFHVESHVFTQTVHVVKEISRPFILGQDFLQQYDAVITFNTDQNTLHLKSSAGSNQRQPSGILQLACMVTLPPRSQMLVPVKARNADVISLMNAVVTPVRSFASRHTVMGARCVTNIRQGECPYLILNPNDYEITVKKSACVARYDPVDQLHEEQEMNDPSKGGNNSANPEPVVETISNEQESAEQEAHYIEVAKDLGFDLSKSELNQDQQREMMIMLGKNRDVFAKNLQELGCTDIHHHRIETGDAAPIKQRPYRTTPEKHQEIERQIKEMSDADLIQPSVSVWQSPVVLVKKKSGQYRFAVDYRRLNQVTEPISYPLPRIEDVFDSIGEAKAKLFSVLDMASGYWQIPLDPETAHKTSFVTHSGVYSFRKLPFGLMNAPSCFSMVMGEVLRGLTFKYALVYVDDILVYSPNFAEHLSHLQDVFDRLRKAGLKLKPEKCQFAASRVPYLGHYITRSGVEMDEAKLKVVKSFPVPKSQKQVRSFIGLCNYYRRFVQDFAKIAKPLNDLFKKTDMPFRWTDECQSAFEKLKQALVSEPIVLQYPDFNREFTLSCDASDYAIGYILGQLDDNGGEHVVAYAGRSLNSAERKWHIKDKECLAIVEGMRHFKVYLARDKEFTIYTDHKALEYMKTAQESAGRIYRWSVEIMHYKYKVKHKAGSSNGNADCLSRREYDSSPDDSRNEVITIAANSMPSTAGEYQQIDFEYAHRTPTPQLNSIASLDQAEQHYEQMSPITLLAEIVQPDQSVQQHQDQDEDLGPMVRYLKDKDNLPADEKVARRIIHEAKYFVLDNNGLLYHFDYPKKKGRPQDSIVKQLAIPKTLQDDVLRSYHDSLAGGGHQGAERTIAKVREKYYWRHMNAHIEEYVKSCVSCQQSKRHYHARPAPLTPLPPTDVFSRLHMDFLGPLKKTKEGYQYILLVVDSYTKWCEAFALKTADATEVANVLYHQIICRYGAPDTLVSDRGQQFISKLVKELCKIFEITKVQTSSYHPESNSACERMNSVILQALRSYVSKDQEDWPQMLQSIMMSYRITPATQSTQFSPYFLLFGRECKLPIDVALRPTEGLPRDVDTYARKLLERLEVCRELARENTLKAQEKYSKQHNKKASEPEFHPTNRVWLYCSKVPTGVSKKLVCRWTGPYYITRVYDKHTFKLRECATNKPVKSLVHSNRLKIYVDPENRPTNTPAAFQNHQQQLNPELILDNQPDSTADETPSDTEDAGTAEQIQQPTTSHPHQAQMPAAPAKVANPKKAPNPDVPHERLQGLTIKRIVKRDRKWFKVEFEENNQRLWLLEHLIPDNLVREFFTELEGKRKRRKRRKKS